MVCQHQHRTCSAHRPGSSSQKEAREYIMPTSERLFCLQLHFTGTELFFPTRSRACYTTNPRERSTVQAAELLIKE